MKKILLAAVMFVGVINSLSAQDFKKVSNAFLLNQIEYAKTELDKLMADPKAQEKPDGWFWKAKIYAYFYNNAVLSTKYPKSQVKADEAYQKYVSLDPSLKVLKKPENSGQEFLFNLYAPSFNSGIGAFNSKNWDSAYYYFSFAVKYSDVIFKNKFSKNPDQAFDTTSILYAGYAAQNAQKNNEAVSSYSRLISSNIGGKTYIDVYRFCLINSINTKNEKDFKKYLDASKAMYPQEDWEDYELSFFNKNFSLAEKTAMYDKEDATGNMSSKKYLQYGEVFANISKEDKESIDSTKQSEYLKKAASAFKKAFYKNTTDGIAAFNAGVIYYNLFGLYDDRVSQAKRSLQELNSNRVIEKDPKKKAIADAKFKLIADSLKTSRIALEKPLIEAGDSSITWLETEISLLKGKTDKTREEKNCLNKSVDYLANIFSYKREKARGKDLKAYDLYDEKYKLYDGLHDSFK